LSGDILAESRLSPEQHAEIQKSLIDRGLMKGAPNGEFDENTRQAVKEFQKAAGSAQTGFLSADEVVQLRQNSPSSATRRDGTDGSSLTQAELDPLRARLTKLWNVPSGQGRLEELIVDVRIHLGRDRKLSAVPEIVSRGSSSRYKAAADAAVRAVIQGQPYDMLKDETYDQWKDMIVTFDPRQMFDGGAGTVASKSVPADTVFPDPAPKTFDQNKISELLDKRDPTRHSATGEPSQSPKRDPDDVVAMVLNYSTFGKDDGENGSFWYKDGSEGCVYKRYLNKISTADAKVDLMLNMLSVTGPERLDLNELDPQNLRSGYDEQLWQDYGYMTVVEHIDQLITASRKSLDNDRLKRGWALIYKKYCTGKKKPF
jgi:peptidoglycan hydrolase-like protein with peptidoglycan-binding domain